MIGSKDHSGRTGDVDSKVRDSRRACDHIGRTTRSQNNALAYGSVKYGTAFVPSLRGEKDGILLKVYISGIHSDPDPSPGVSIARSLRVAFPKIELVGVDYSAKSTGLHSRSFDGLWIQRPWNEIVLQQYREQILQRLSQESAYWISGLDTEIDWLSIGERHPHLLIPDQRALVQTRKPQIPAALLLGMRVPKSIPAWSAPIQLHRFGRRHSWNLWVKGVYHSATRVNSWNELQHGIDAVGKSWGIDSVFVQEGVEGVEESYILSAYRGQLLGVGHMEKRTVTGTGKTWAGSVRGVASGVREKIEHFVRVTGWTGGCEIEFIRSLGGDEYLLDLNPRFPAWVHGATLCGLNLPARLVETVTGAAMEGDLATTSVTQFARIVVEVPVNSFFPIPPLAPSLTTVAAGKHPSSQPQLAKRLHEIHANALSVASRNWPAMGGQSHGIPGAIETVLSDVNTTPIRVPLPGVLEQRVRLITTALESFRRPALVAALSLKTHPSRSLVRLAASEPSWMAEAISEAEVRCAADNGFSAQRIILNGPGATGLVDAEGLEAGIVFHDSLESFQRDKGTGQHVKGIRLRPPRLSSRFGVAVEDWSVFQRLVKSIGGLSPDCKYGVHFHYPSDTCGVRAWWELVESTADWAHRISKLTGRPVTVFDVGGGWHHEDFLGEDESFLGEVGRLHELVKSRLPSVEMIVFEPGKAISAPSYVLVAKVTEIRAPTEDGGRDIVVDASIADLPMACLSAHPLIAACHTGLRTAFMVGPGRDRVLGSICMESDIMARAVHIPEQIALGDRIVFLDAGGYNASMAWDFAKGRTRDGV